MSIDHTIFHRNGSRGVHGKYANFVATKASVTKMSPLQYSSRPSHTSFVTTNTVFRMDVTKMRDDLLTTICSVQWLATTQADTATSKAIF